MAVLFYLSVNAFQSDAIEKEINILDSTNVDGRNTEYFSINIGGYMTSQLFQQVYLSNQEHVTVNTTKMKLIIDHFEDEKTYISRSAEITNSTHITSVLKKLNKYNVISMVFEDEFDYEMIYDLLYISKYKGKGTEVKLPEKVGDVAVYGLKEKVFINNNSIETIDFGKIKSVETMSISNCSKLKKVICSDNIESLPFSFIHNTPSLEQVVLPSKLESFLYESICSSSSIEIELPDTVSGIHSLHNRFKDCTFYDFTVEDYKMIKVSKDNPYFSFQDGVIYNKDKTTIMYLPSFMLKERLIIPESFDKFHMNNVGGLEFGDESASNPIHTNLCDLDHVSQLRTKAPTNYTSSLLVNFYNIKNLLYLYFPLNLKESNILLLYNIKQDLFIPISKNPIPPKIVELAELFDFYDRSTIAKQFNENVTIYVPRASIDKYKHEFDPEGIMNFTFKPSHELLLELELTNKKLDV